MEFRVSGLGADHGEFFERSLEVLLAAFVGFRLHRLRAPGFGFQDLGFEFRDSGFGFRRGPQRVFQEQSRGLARSLLRISAS